MTILVATVTKCPECGYENQPRVCFCGRCGAPLRKFSRARALALVEGTAGVGKSVLISNLIQYQMQQTLYMNTLVRLGQGHTYGPLAPDEVNSPFTAKDHLNYLERVYQTLEFLSHPGGSSSNPPVMCVIETLHLTLACRPGLLSREQILEYGKKLSAIGCKLIFVRVTPETHWERCIWERRNNGFINKYGAKYGSNLKEIHNYYVSEQERMLELFEQSSMVKLLLDGESCPETLVEEAYRFWVG